MHQIKIPQNVIERAVQRRGSVEVYSGLAPRRTALLAVDMQNGFMARGQPAESASARAIVDNINELARATRQAGGLVVWIKHTAVPRHAAGAWPRFLEFSAEWGERLNAVLVPGHEGHELYPDMDVRDGDEVVLKTRFSPFIEGSSDLHERLRKRGVDTVIVAGTVTNVCCESTARDAMMLDYKVHFVADATAARTDAEQNATLANMMLWFADVRTTGELVALLDVAPPAAC